MRKISYFLAVALFSSQLFATYIVVLKNGTRYKAKERWTVSNGKAIVRLENGSTIQLDPSLIDVPKSEAATKSGLRDATVLTVPVVQRPTRAQQTSLGDTVRMRRQPEQGASTTNQAETTLPNMTSPATAPGMLGNDVTSKFVSAYENIGFYESKVTGSAPYTLRVQLNADNEDQVFKAISATAYVMLRVPTLTNKRLDMVELLMSTFNGGTAGRFQMTQEDAKALDSKAMTIEQYFIRKVIF